MHGVARPHAVLDLQVPETQNLPVSHSESEEHNFDDGFGVVSGVRSCILHWFKMQAIGNGHSLEALHPDTHLLLTQIFCDGHSDDSLHCGTKQDSDATS